MRPQRQPRAMHGSLLQRLETSMRHLIAPIRLGSSARRISVSWFCSFGIKRHASVRLLLEASRPLKPAAVAALFLFRAAVAAGPV